MEKIKTILRQTEFHVLCFVFSFLLFSYPLLVMSNRARTWIIILSLFGPWLVIIISLHFISKSYPDTPQDLIETADGEEHNV